MSVYTIRNIDKTDFDKEYLYLLKQLSPIEIDKITREMFNNFIDRLNEHHQIYVIQNSMHKNIIGTITILIEPKIIHTMGLVAHIEDVVIKEQFRGLKLSRLLINKAIEVAKNKGCYKIILDCSDNNKPVYETYGFNTKGNQMALYF